MLSWDCSLKSRRKMKISLLLYSDYKIELKVHIRFFMVFFCSKKWNLNVQNIQWNVDDEKQKTNSALIYFVVNHLYKNYTFSWKKNYYLMSFLHIFNVVGLDFCLLLDNWNAFPSM